MALASGNPTAHDTSNAHRSPKKRKAGVKGAASFSPEQIAARWQSHLVKQQQPEVQKIAAARAVLPIASHRFSPYKLCRMLRCTYHCSALLPRAICCSSSLFCTLSQAHLSGVQPCTCRPSAACNTRQRCTLLHDQCAMSNTWHEGVLTYHSKCQQRSPCRQQILDAVASNQVVLIRGETGCGKTTQVPQYLLDASWEQGKACRVLCTQPRRISAVSVADRVATERGESIGDSVGYTIRLESK